MTEPTDTVSRLRIAATQVLRVGPVALATNEEWAHLLREAAADIELLRAALDKAQQWTPRGTPND